MKNITLVTCAFLLLGGVAAAQEPSLMTLDQALAEKNLDRDAIQEKTCVVTSVFDPISQSFDAQKSVCEVWTKPRTIPAEPVYLKTGEKLYSSTKTWTFRTTRPHEEQRSDKFAVKKTVRKETPPPQPTPPPKTVEQFEWVPKR